MWSNAPMNEQHLIGIDVIDQQHEEIHEVASSAIEAIQSGDKWHVVHYILIRLHELLRIHFAVEEGLMQALNFPETDSHRDLHRDYLATVEQLRHATLHNDGATASALDEHHISFLEHILDHDMKLAEYIKTKSALFRS